MLECIGKVLVRQSWDFTVISLIIMYLEAENENVGETSMRSLEKGGRDVGVESLEEHRNRRRNVADEGLGW